MRKWSFWGLMCAAALFHGLCFFRWLLALFREADPLVLLLVDPVNWFLAALVLWSWWMGRAWIAREYRFSLSGMLFFARRSCREKRWGAVFFLLTGVLVWRGLLLIHHSDLWTALYLASGLVLFLLFYFWLQAGGERGVVVVQLMCALLACAVWLLLAGSWAASAPWQADASAPWQAEGDPAPDLIVYNDSTTVIGGITAATEQERKCVSLSEPMERGESWGLFFVDGGRAAVELWDLEGRSAGRCHVDLEERRIYVTLGEHGQHPGFSRCRWRRRNKMPCFESDLYLDGMKAC